MTFRADVLGALAVAAVLLAAAVVGTSCRQLVEVEERRACDGEQPAAQSECAACRAASCCVPLLECAGDARCRTLDHCLSSCAGDAACRVACRDEHRFEPNATALVACESAACAAACGLPCGGYVFPTAECDECAATSCCSQAAACGGDADCLGLSTCAWGCALDDASCRGECMRRHAAGEQPARALTQCLQDACATECFPPPLPVSEPNWSCLGDVPDPPQCSGLVEVHYGYGDFQTGLPWVGVAVRACDVDERDLECVSPVASGVTDDTGTAQLFVPCGFRGYFRAEGGGTALEPEKPLTTLLFLVYPIVSGPFTTGVAMIPYAAYQAYYAGVSSLTPGRGHVYTLGVFACDGSFPAGVSFSLEPNDPGLVQYYGDHGENPGSTTTIDNNLGGFLDVEPGVYRLVAELVGDEGPGCITAPRIFIRPDAETDVELRPATVGCR